MIVATAFEPNATDPVWLLVLPGEWTGPMEGSIATRMDKRENGLVLCATRHGNVAFAATAEAAIRARGCRIVEAGRPPCMGPTLSIAWRDRFFAA